MTALAVDTQFGWQKGWSLLCFAVSVWSQWRCSFFLWSGDKKWNAVVFYDLEMKDQLMEWFHISPKPKNVNSTSDWHRKSWCKGIILLDFLAFGCTWTVSGTIKEFRKTVRKKRPSKSLKLIRIYHDFEKA